MPSTEISRTCLLVRLVRAEPDWANAGVIESRQADAPANAVNPMRVRREGFGIGSPGGSIRREALLGQ